MATILAVAALVVALLALAIAAATARLAGAWRRRRGRTRHIPADLATLRDEVQLLRADADQALRHVSVVRYDAFGDMGGHLSWSMALLDDAGDGVLLTAIHGRSDARTYAKNVSDWTCDQQTSPEEDEALQQVRVAR
jgi:hypothetical protein